jgi:MFS family permease
MTPPATPHKIPARAWGIVALVSLALLLFILDRQVLAVLKTTLKARMGWTDVDYSWLVTGFSVAYTLGALFAGRFIDRFGTRLTASLSIGVMSIAAILCGTATNFFRDARRARCAWFRGCGRHGRGRRRGGALVPGRAAGDGDLV